MLSPDETVLFVGNTFTGGVGAIPFNKKTGVPDPAHSCTSSILKNYLASWIALGSLAFADEKGKGGELYAAEGFFSSAIAIVKYAKVKGDDEPCELNESADSPIADPASTSLTSITRYPPRSF